MITMTETASGKFQQLKSEQLLGRAIFIVPALVEILRHRRPDELVQLRGLVANMLAQVEHDDSSVVSRTNLEVLRRELDDLFHELSMLIQTNR